MKVESLTDKDLTHFMACQKCNRKGQGVRLGDINCKAYTKAAAESGPECENCSTPMVLLYIVGKDQDA